MLFLHVYMLLESFLLSGDQEETNDDGADRAEEDNMTQLSQFSQHQECLKCNLLYNVQETDDKWSSICKKCYAQLNLSEQREELIAHVSLKCCNGNCEQDQFDSCSNCKKAIVSNIVMVITIVKYSQLMIWL